MSRPRRPETWRGDPFPDALARRRARRRAGVGQDQRELVAAESGDDVGFPRAAANDRRRLRPAHGCRQDARGVSLIALEPVQVDEQQRKRPAAARRALAFRAAGPIEVTRVVQLGQVVGDRERLGALQQQRLSRANRQGSSSTSNERAHGASERRRLARGRRGRRRPARRRTCRDR